MSVALVLEIELEVAAGGLRRCGQVALLDRRWRRSRAVVGSDAVDRSAEGLNVGVAGKIGAGARAALAAGEDDHETDDHHQRQHAGGGVAKHQPAPLGVGCGLLRGKPLGAALLAF